MRGKLKSLFGAISTGESVDAQWVRYQLELRPFWGDGEVPEACLTFGYKVLSYN